MGEPTNSEKREYTDEEKKAYHLEKKKAKRKKQRDKQKHKDKEKKSTKTSTNSNAKKWKGSKAGLNGHVFQLPDEQHSKPNQFTRTLEEMITFVKTNFEHGSDAAYILKNEELPVVECPKEPEENASKSAQFKWEQNYKRYDARMEALRESQSKLFSLILGQCSPKLVSKLNSMQNYIEIRDDANECIALLSLIRSIFYNFTEQKNIYSAIDDAWRQYYLCEQKPNESLDDFKDRFEAVVKTLEFYGCSVGHDTKLVQHELDKLGADIDIAVYAEGTELDDDDAALLTQAKFNAGNKSAAVSFLKRGDPKRFYELLADLDNEHLLLC